MHRLAIPRLLPWLAVFATVGGVTGCYFDLNPIEPVGARSDADGDGFGPSGDCNDENPLIFPGADEVCGDGVDNDCDGKIDAADPECDAGSGGQGAGTGGEGGNSRAGGGGAGGQGGAGSEG